MMNSKLYFLSLLLFFACANSKKINENKSGKIVIIKPYCGGAKPSPELANGRETPYSNSIFYLKSKMNNDKKESTIAKIRTDKEGNFSIKVPNGKYFLIHESKTMRFEEYKQYYLKEQTEWKKYIGDEVAKKVFLNADFEIEINNNIDLKIKYREKCFIGLNPLLKYIGPLPQ